MSDGRVGERVDAAWRDRAGALLDRYHRLAAAYTRCGKHRQPKSNLAILRSALEDVVAGRGLPPRTRGLLQPVVDAMVRRRGEPGSARHTELRAQQSAAAVAPTHHELARVVAARLAELPQTAGIHDVDAVVGPVRLDEARATGLPAGAVIPAPILRVVRRALAGTVEELIAAGVVPSAEVLAGLVPQLAAATTAAPYRDDALRTLMAATYAAFRRRRSLLLLNLEHQVHLDELPWVRAVAGHRRVGDDTRSSADATLRRLGELTLDAFPATLPPNPLVRELAALSRTTGEELPWVEELAADIFEGTFSAKYLAAAKVAGGLLAGSLYERYYDIDYAQVLAIDDVSRRGRYAAATSPTFDALCRTRSGATGGRYSVAANGMVIEQAQVLTTHNLATLVGRVGVRPAADWSTLARRAFATATTLAARVPGNPRPLSTIKDVAYAWRHLVFYLSLPGSTDPAAVVDQLHADLEAGSPPARNLLRPALAGLAHIAAGGSFALDGTAGAGSGRLLGWSDDRHWMLPPHQRC